MLAAEQLMQEPNTDVELSTEKLSVKTERRDSTTSESSLEHLDLGHTPKKFKAHTSTPTQSDTGLKYDSSESHHVRSRESGEDASEDPTKTKISKISDALTPRPKRHHKRRLNYTDKHASVLLEYNAANPNSLRKKFRFNRSTSEIGSSLINNNESGFVDGSSQYINTSGPPNSQSSGSSSPQEGSSSSPEGASENNVEREREEMKYLCPICEVVSATPHEFTNHIRCHNYASGDTENFTCRICSKVLSSASSLDRHVLVHTGERPFNCKYCHLTFTTNGNMHRHMRTHKQHQHNSQRRSSHGINKHNQNNNNNNQSQQNNNHTPSNNYAIITKNGKASVAATNMPNDNKFGANNEQINSIHEVYESDEVDGEISCHKSRRIDEIDEDDEPDDCSTDSSSIKSHSIIHNIKKNLNNLKHNKSSQQDNKNIDLSETNENDAMLKHCIKTINNNTMDVPDMHEMSCPVCESASFNNLLSLSEHMDSEHAEIPAKCRRCEVVFRTHRQLNVHPCSGMKQLGIGDLTHEKFPLMLREVTSAERLAETEALQFQIRSYLSEHSEGKSQLNNFGVPAESMENEQLTSETELLQQKRDHILRKIFLKQDSNSKIAETQPTENSTTPVKFESLELENTQTLSQDSKDFADIQSILNMTSSSSTSNFLKNFEQSVNTPSSNYSFDKDEEEAQDAFTAEFRKMKLRGEFPCKLCTAIYPNLRALKGHNRVHLSSVGPAGPFRCNMCPYSICDKSALVRHMRTHNGDRPYECAACNYAFTTKANCERHLRNRHGKTTREEVKRSIIYHPSEDSSCDDPTKKLHMFSSPDLDEDFIDLPYTQAPEPKDRSTPVSHLKEMLTNVGYETTAVKAHIQVKSLEKLIDKGSPYADSAHADVDEATSSAPIDLSMDVLDLSKKANTTVKQPEDLHINNNTVEEKSAMIVENGETDFNAMENNEKMAMLLAQQQQMLLNDSFPKFVDPAQYMQQLYRQLMFQPLNPFFLPNPMFASGLRDMDKLGPLMKRLFNLPETDNAVNQSNLPTMPNTINIPKQTHSIGSPSLIKDSNSLLTDKPNNATNFNLQLPMSKKTVDANLMNTELSRNVNLPPATMLPGGPVKMVIKNGVLMPKQKQRRYRTERPFACEHCSARFTLRSNMERHVKQQHPQYYAQRHRNGTHIIRGRGVNSGLMPNMSHLETAMSGQNSTGAGNAGISDQVKYAILAQQLKANRRDSSEILQQALSHGSGSILAPNHLLFGGNSSPSLIANEAFNSNNTNAINCSAEDDDPKLVIDEEKIENDAGEFEENYEADKVEIEEEKQPIKENLKENVVPKILDTKDKEAKQEGSVNAAAKKVAETILEQAIKDGQILVPTTKTESLLPPPLAIPLLPAPPPPPPPSTLKSMIAHAESVGKFLKEVASSPFKDESQDLVPVSKLVDNATNNSVSFTNIFRPSDVTNHMEQSDEEGLVASGSASESNNSGTEDVVAPVEPKKKSAYSLAPNRVSCPYCQRMFPWSSSLRRHILTHTGQKPFKCSHCPLLFTTKSNCDRHLLRKHGNIESAVSVYVPTEDVTEPIPVPKSVEEIEQQQRRREEDERRRQHEELAAKERMQRELLERQKQLQLQQEDDQKQLLLKQFANANMQQANNNNNIINPKMESNVVSPAELPYKCHLCESSFGERFQCLEHIKHLHAQDFDLLIAKGAVDTDTNQSLIDEEERRTVDESGRNVTSGKYPDYSNRKVICAFCIRRFWSTEDLRRHMRTHSGERPFQCEICLRKFTLKHSMLRHMKKHIGRAYGGQTNGDVASAGNSGSDFSDDEQGNSLTMSNTLINNSNNAILARNKMQELFEKANEWRNSRVTSEIVDHKENISDESNNHQSDLIGNLLGISDQGILNKLLSSPDEAAKLLGVEK